MWLSSGSVRIEDELETISGLQTDTAAWPGFKYFKFAVLSIQHS